MLRYVRCYELQAKADSTLVRRDLSPPTPAGPMDTPLSPPFNFFTMVDKIRGAKGLLIAF